MHQRVPTVEFIHKFRARIVLTLPTALRSRYCFRRLATISLDHHRASLITENFSLTHFDGLSVPCALRLPRQKSSSRLVIIAPGFLGFKDWGFFPFLAERLCRVLVVSDLQVGHEPGHSGVIDRDTARGQAARDVVGAVLEAVLGARVS